MKNYYHILGVSQSATAEEIKRSYRRLAIQYHPDKNPDPKAEAIFKEITEAYDVVGDATKRVHYDFQFRNPFVENVQDNTIYTPRHRDPAYRRKGPPVYRKSQQSRVYELMTDYFPVVKISTGFCFSIAVFLLIDFSLPSLSTHEKIIAVDVKRTYSRNNSTSWLVVKTNTYTIDLPIELSAADFPVGQFIEIQSSRILRIPTQVQTNFYRVPIDKSLYGNFIFAPLALLVVSAGGIYYRKNVEYGFNFGVVSFLILILTGVLFLLS